MTTNHCTLTYRLSFNTPAFLGNAEQQAQWRTPPIKALIRQWWRVVKAADPAIDFNHGRLLDAENDLFGAAGDEGDRHLGQSKLRLRLTRWADGTMQDWPDLRIKVRHPEVDGGREVGADLYLGFGPLAYSKELRRTTLGTSKSSAEIRTAIAEAPNSKSDQELMLRLPDAHRQDVADAIQLAAWFGTLGSRSRNGLGSLDMVAVRGTLPLQPLTFAAVARFCRPLAECLKVEWAHAIGQLEDGSPAMWATPGRGSWYDVMRDLAAIKIAFRHRGTPLTRNGEDPVRGEQNLAVDRRHLLGYPVTHHGVGGPLSADGQSLGWVDADRGGQRPKTDKRGYTIQSARLASQVRFKVSRQGSQWTGVIVHLPCALPRELRERLSADDQAFVRRNELQIWRDVHAVLEQQARRFA